MFKAFIISLYLHSINLNAYEDKSFQVGIRPTFLNLFNKVTSQETGDADIFGTVYWLPIFFGSTFLISDNWFFNPSLTYSLIPRENSSGDIKERLFFLSLPIGRNLQTSNETTLDWNLQTGLFQYSLEGSGRSYTDGAGTQFYYPRSDSQSRLIYIGGGFGLETSRFRGGLDLWILNFLNNDKRNFNFIFTLAYKGLY